jgi:hypothetical protein
LQTSAVGRDRTDIGGRGHWSEIAHGPERRGLTSRRG